MALAAQADVQAVLGRNLTAPEQALVGSQLDAASDLVLAYLGCDPAPNPVPGAVVRVVAAMVASLINRPANQPVNAEQINAGPFGLRYAEGSTSGAPWLTQGLKDRLGPYRCRGRSAVSVPLASERTA